MHDKIISPLLQTIALHNERKGPEMHFKQVVIQDLRVAAVTNTTERNRSATCFVSWPSHKQCGKLARDECGIEFTSTPALSRHCVTYMRL